MAFRCLLELAVDRSPGFVKPAEREIAGDQKLSRAGSELMRFVTRMFAIGSLQRLPGAIDSPTHRIDRAIGPQHPGAHALQIAHCGDVRLKGTASDWPGGSESRLSLIPA